MNNQTETYADTVLGFTLPDRNARGRLVRLDQVLDSIIKAHNYPAPITHLLAEALVLGALMGSLLKGQNAQMTMQAQAKDTVVSLLVCDYRAGGMRGYAEFDDVAFSQLGANPSLPALLGNGFLAITFEANDGTGAVERYQGIVPLEGDTLAEACESYFVQSEQVPTVLRVASATRGETSSAAGLLIQHLADGEEGRERLHVRLDHPDWEHVQTLASTISHSELLDKELSMEAIAWRLFHEEQEIRSQPIACLSQACRCSHEHYERIILRFPKEERDQMRDEEGIIKVNCEFCSVAFSLNV